MSDSSRSENAGVQKVVEMIERLGKISGLRPDQDVYTAGFSSIRTLELLMEIEDAFSVAIPDDGRFPAARTALEIHALVESLRQ